MIRKFIKGDEDRLDPNEFSGVDDIRPIFEDDSFIKHTLEDDGEIMCIMCWKQYMPKHYAIFFLMPEGVKFKHARALKRFLDNATMELKPRSCMTYSKDCKMLNRWHEFFGFEKQRSGLMEAVEGFNKWVIKWV